jgi:hypothetical protein
MRCFRKGGYELWLAVERLKSRNQKKFTVARGREYNQLMIETEKITKVELSKWVYPNSWPRSIHCIER